VSAGRALCYAVAVGVSVVLAACSASSAGSPSATASAAPAKITPSVSTYASKSPTDPSSVALDVYRGMWADWVEAAKTSDYSSPRLGDHATSQALLLVSGSLHRAHDANIVARGAPSLAPHVTHVTSVTPSASPVAVSIADCVDATGWVNYTADGQPQNRNPGGKHEVTATVGLLDDRWRVTHLTVGETGSCT